MKDVFYYQISTVYAILISCCASLFQGNITQPHASIAIAIASSPVSIYFLVYSLRAFWGEHRLDTVLGRRNYINRGLVFLAVGIWTFALVYTLRKPSFAQAGCHRSRVDGVDDSNIVEFMFGIVFLYGTAAFPAFWLVCIILARKEIWPPGERYRPKVFTVW